MERRRGLAHVLSNHRVSKLRLQAWCDVGVKQRDQTDHDREQRAVLERKAEQFGFFVRLHAGGGRGHRDTRQADHFAHHTAGGIGRCHQHRIESELGRGYHLQVAKERISGCVGTGKRNIVEEVAVLLGILMLR